MLRNHVLVGTFSFLCTVLSAGTATRPAEAADIAAGQAPVATQTAVMRAAQQITQAINNSHLSPMQNDVRPEVATSIDQGRVNDNLPLDNMLLLLHRPAAQEQALEAFMVEQTTPGSPNYQSWLTAEQVGQYGPAPSDIETISSWLQSQGFTVNTVHADGMMIDFSGTAGQVRQTFKSEVHTLNVGGVQHVANVSVPQIPSALAPAVVGIVSINDFTPHTNYKPKPDYTFTSGTSTEYAMVPADLATIYNLTPLFNATPTAINGAGQTIVLVEDTNVYKTADITTFRSIFGLPTATFSTVHPGSCTTPGIVTGNDGEAELDVEWAGAAAPGSALVLASCKDTASTFGGLIAMQNLNTANDAARLWSISYGQCEAENGATANAAYVSTYQTAAARGVSVFVSSGDEGAASCDPNTTVSTHGVGVSGFASTPYNVAVGGTDFGDSYAGTNSTYWGTTNTTTFGSAKSYVNEIPWNDSCASVLLATIISGSGTTYGTGGFCNSTTASNDGLLTTASGSGGPSGCATGTATTIGVISGSCAGTAKPSWQSGFLGNPADGLRDIPDVSLFAANGVWGHYYVYCYSHTNGGGVACTGAPSGWSGAGGTSFSSPIMAGIQALVNQKTGVSQGNPNPTYYSLATTEYGASGSSTCNSTRGNGVASTCIFYDVTQGDMDVNCSGTHNCYIPSGTNGVLSTSNAAYQAAYGTQTGWDFATGIGSVNAANLVNSWPTSGKLNQTITFTSTAPAGAAVGGATYTVTATASSGLTVALTIDATATSVCSLSGSTVSFIAAGTCVIDGNQAGNGSYNAAPQKQQSFAVNQANQTITFPNRGPVTYSLGGTFALGATASSGLTVSYVSNSTGVCTVSVSTATIVTAGTCSITASQAGNANYSAAPSVTDSIGINQASQTIAFTSTAPSPAVGGNYMVAATGGASGNPVTFSIDASSTAGACTISSPTVSFTGAGSCIIDANQAGNTNYSAATQVQQTVTVGKGSQTITFTSTAPAGAIVGGATYTVSATASSNLTVALTIDASASAVCSLSGATVTFSGVGNCIIDANQAGNTNYNVAAQAQQTVAVGKGSQTISFTSIAPTAATVGGAPYTVAATASSGLAVALTIDASATAVCSLSGSTVSFTGPGNCVIDANQAGNTNYNVATQVQQTFAVGQGRQTITFPNPGAQTYSPGGKFTLGATASSGLAVSYVSNSTGVCTVSGSLATIVTAGSCSITANQAGNTNYSAATPVIASVTIGAASQTITFTSTSPASPPVGGNYTVAATGGGSGNPVTFGIDASSTAGACTISGATVSFTGIGSCIIDANQAGDTNYSVATQVQQAVAIGVASQTITFPNPVAQTYSAGGTFVLSATASSGLAVSYVSNSTGVCTVSGSSAMIVTAGICSITASQAGNTSYSAATPVTDSITINPAGQTIVFTSTPTNPAVGGNYNVSASGGASGNAVLFNIDATSSAGACTITGSAVSFAAMGTCVIDANQAGNAGYSAAPQMQQSFAVGIGPATQLVFTTQPAAVLAGSILGSVAVTEEDQAGDVINDSTSLVNFTIAACGGSVNLGSVTLTNGVGALSGSSQVFYTVTSGLQINAATGTLRGQSAGFNVAFNTDILFDNGFETCRL